MQAGMKVMPPKLDVPAGAAPPQTVVAQLGARRHYAVPLLLQNMNMLSHFYTDTYSGTGWMESARKILQPLARSTTIKSLFNRRCDLPPAKVTGFNLLGLLYAMRLRRTAEDEGSAAVKLWAGEKFNRQVIRSDRLQDAEVVYGFNSASEILFRHCRERGITCILDQTIAARRVHDVLIQEEIELWPGWETVPISTGAEAFYEREQNEWELAHSIFCGSRYVADTLEASGVAAGKCTVVPYGTDVNSYAADRTVRDHHDRLRVLFVGSIGLRKGIQYLLRAARLLPDTIQVRVVGGVSCNIEKLTRECPSNVHIIKRVPRNEMPNHYEWADVFCLPTLCEGSAAVSYEAMASGLPVVCTPNCGSVVRDGVDGFIVPVRDSEAIAEKMMLFADDRELVSEMSRNAVKRAGEFNWSRYGERLAAAIIQTVGARK